MLRAKSCWRMGILCVFVILIVLSSLISHLFSLSLSQKGALMISGAFDMEFSHWWRYREIFQHLIVPELCEEFLIKYGKKIEQEIGFKQIQKISHACKCYF